MAAPFVAPPPSGQPFWAFQFVIRICVFGAANGAQPAPSRSHKTAPPPPPSAEACPRLARPEQLGLRSKSSPRIWATPKTGRSCRSLKFMASSFVFPARPLTSLAPSPPVNSSQIIVATKAQPQLDRALGRQVLLSRPAAAAASRLLVALRRRPSELAPPLGWPFCASTARSPILG